MAEYFPRRGDLTDFGAEADNKHVVGGASFVLEGTTDGASWSTLAADQYTIYKREAMVEQRLADNSGNPVDWDDYLNYQDAGNQAFRVTYVTNNNGAKTPYTQRPITFNQVDPTTPNGGGMVYVLVEATDIGNEAITSQKIYATIQSDNYSAGSAGWQIQRDTGNAEFNNVTVRGTIYASLGAVGGFTIGSDYVKDAADSFGMASTVTAGDDVRFWAGAAFASRASAPFYVTESGLVFAKDVILAKGALTGASGATGYGYAVDPLLLCHFDGPQPFESDFRGSAIGHKGQVDTRAGGVIFRRGLYNKAIQFAAGATNKVLNPSAETTGNFATRGTATVTRDTTKYLFGATSYKVVLAAANDGVDLTLSALANAIHYVTLHATGSALSTLQVSLDGSNWNALTSHYSETDSGGNTWTRYGVQIPAVQANGSTTLRIRNTANSGTFYIDAVQVEQSSGLTPYLDGSLGDGHSWSGTAHASTSTRTAANLTYAASGNINLAQGSLSFWFLTPTANNNSSFPVAFDAYIDANNILRVNLCAGAGVMRIYVDATSGGVNKSTFTGAETQYGTGWHHFVFTWSASANALKAYLDGAPYGNTSQTYTAPVGTLTNITLGSTGVNSLYANTLFDDLAILPIVLSDHEIKSIYYSTAPLMLAVSNQEFRLSGPGLGEVFGNANGLFGRSAAGVPSFGLTNAAVNASTWGGASETINAASLLLGDNHPSKANILIDSSSGKAYFRAGTTSNIYIGTDGSQVFNADAGSYAKWVAGSATLGEMWSGHSGGFGTLALIGRGYDVTDASGAVKIQAYKYDNSQNSYLTVGSYGSATLTGIDGVASQLVTRYASDFAGGTTVQNTNVETTIYSATIKANALSSAGIVRVTLGGDLQNNSGGAITLTFRVKFGGTTVNTLKVSVASFTGTGGYYLEAVIANNGNSNAQRGFANLTASKNGTWDATSADYGTSAINSTSDQTLSITAQWASASSTAGVFSKGGMVEMIRTD